MMDIVFAAIEDSALSEWLKQTLYAFPVVLVLHALGMAAMAGTGMAFALRALGVARSARFSAMMRFFPVLWGGLVVNAFSGTLLLIAYPTKALTNPVFYLKVTLLGLALYAVLRLRDAARAEEISAGTKWIAVASLLFWIGAIFAGRFLAYTYTRLFVDMPGSF
jgi:hypothetical protein